MTHRVLELCAADQRDSVNCAPRSLKCYEMFLLIAGFVSLTLIFSVQEAQAQQAYGKQWGGTYTTRDWERFYHYPYVFYPQNFWAGEYYRSSENLYYRYPPEMRIPVYNRQWHNYYPASRSYLNGRSFHAIQGPRYHSGHHFLLDVF